MRKILFMLSLVLLIVFVSACSSGPGRYDSFAQCLTAKNITMYGTTWCTHCQAQKAMFGSSFDFVNFVDCDKHPGECSGAGVTGYPTWYINNTDYPGETPLYTLSQLSGCKIE